jgi:hypothetical protein
MSGSIDLLTALDLLGKAEAERDEAERRFENERRLNVEVRNKLRGERARVAELEQREKIAVEAAQEFHDDICRLQEARDNWHASNYAERQARLVAEARVAELEAALETIANQDVPRTVTTDRMEVVIDGEDKSAVYVKAQSPAAFARAALAAVRQDKT